MLKRDRAEAAAEAHAIREAARAEAAAILERAHRDADVLREQVRTAATREAEAAVSAAFIRLRSEQAAHAAEALDDIIALARILAERLLGEALALDPPRVVGLAREVLVSVRRARRIEIFAHPDDAAALERDVEGLGVEAGVVEIHADPTRGRGDLRVRTDLGALDADLSPQLDRLTAALRDRMRAG